MDNYILGKKPPKQYVEGFIKYNPYTLDGNMNLLSLVENGYTIHEAERMLKLYRIEALTHHFEEAKKEFDPANASEEELNEYKEYEELIEERIKQYNKEGEAS